MVSKKNAEFDADFESVGKISKKLQQTSFHKKGQKNRVFDFYYCVQKFPPISFLHFFQRIRTQH